MAAARACFIWRRATGVPLVAPTRRAAPVWQSPQWAYADHLVMRQAGLWHAAAFG